MLSQDELKRNVAQAAAEYAVTCLQPDSVLGVGTGSTVDLFIDAIAEYRDRFRAAVSSSDRSTHRMRALGIVVLDLIDVTDMPIFVDGYAGIAYCMYLLHCRVGEHYTCKTDD